MRCEQCHNEKPIRDAMGNCAVCLVTGAMGDPAPYFDAQEPPAVLGEYNVLEEVGRGGASVVYRAQHRKLGRVVALKTLRSSPAVSSDAFERFRIEASAVARLEHPNIVPLYETGSDSGLLFLTLRFFQKGSLAAALKNRQFNPKESAGLILTAARAMHYAHQRGVLHRDLKPSNLLLDEENQPHIADFGLAKLANDDTSLTLSTSVLGTPNYMAPEQAEGRAKDASVASDVYSLGAILFELLTGRPPFLGETPLSVLRQVADEEPPRPSSLNPQVDRDLEAICLSCLEKQPHRRYPGASALADDLERWLKKEPISVRPATAVERSIRWARAHPAVAGLSLAVAVAIAAGMAGTLWQWRIARRTAERARVDSYITAMDLVERLYRSNPQAAKNHLDRFRPAPGEKDLRGWEWRYFWQACRGEKPVAQWTARGGTQLYSTAISTDGKYIAAGEIGGGVHIFDAQTLRPVFEGASDVNTNLSPQMPSGNGVGARVVYIPNRELFAWSETTGISNCVVKFWSVRERKVTGEIRQPYIVRNMVASTDGNRLIVELQSPVSNTLVWDLEKNAVLTRTTRGPGMSNYSLTNPLSISSDGRWMAIEEFPSLIRVMEVETGREVWRLPLEEQYCLASAFSHDGQWIAVSAGFQNSNIEIFDLQTGRLEKKLRSPGWAHRILFSTDGQKLIESATDSILVWNLAKGEVERSIRPSVGALPDLALSPDEQFVYSAGHNGQLKKWLLSEGGSKATRWQGKLSVVFSDYLRFRPDATEELFGVTTNQMVVSTGLERTELFTNGPANCTAACALPIRDAYLVGDASGNVSLRDGRFQKVIRHFKGLDRAALLLRFGAATQTVLGADERKVVVWDFQTGQKRFDFSAPTGESWSEMTPDDRTWTTIYYNGSLEHIDLVTGASTKSKLPFGQVTSFAYSPDRRHAITSSINTTNRLYTADFKYIKPLGDLDSSGGFSVCFSPDGRRVVTGHGGYLRLIDVETGRNVCTLEADIDLSFGSFFSPSGNTLALVGSVAREAYLWRAPTWREISAVEAAGQY